MMNSRAEAGDGEKLKGSANGSIFSGSFQGKLEVNGKEYDAYWCYAPQEGKRKTNSMDFLRSEIKFFYLEFGIGLKLSLGGCRFTWWS
ncbi:hypothetical protein Tco_0150478 [Tanacetum coccineum]